ncbi:hypothetical protein TNCV_1426911 [Trichonephila clavipes]|nr:hypothetical protein TNCV_1426911 [Trichonephila clavipes]
MVHMGRLSFLAEKAKIKGKESQRVETGLHLSKKNRESGKKRSNHKSSTRKSDGVKNTDRMNLQKRDAQIKKTCRFIYRALGKSGDCVKNTDRPC